MKAHIGFILVSWLSLVLANGNGFVKFPVQIKRSSSKQANTLSSLGNIKEVANNDVNLFKNPKDFYAVNITVGTPPVQLQVELDTGSSDLWVISTKAPVCKRYNCNIYGVFDKDKSSSWKSNGTEFGIRYVDGSGNDGGIYGQDTINFGNGLVLNNATFAVANEMVDLVGIMGISFEFREAATQKYPNIPSLMKLQGYTKKTAYSLYVTDEVKQAGSILFGGIDHAKYEGELVSLDMVSSNGTYRALQTELTSIKICINGSCADASESGSSSSVNSSGMPSSIQSSTKKSTKGSSISNPTTSHSLTSLGVSSSTPFTTSISPVSSNVSTGSVGSTASISLSKSPPMLSESSMSIRSSSSSSSIEAASSSKHTVDSGTSFSNETPSTSSFSSSLAQQTANPSATYVLSTLSTAYVSYFTEITETSYYTTTSSRITEYYTQTIKNSISASNSTSAPTWIEYYNQSLQMFESLKALLQKMTDLYNQQSQAQSSSSNNKKRQVIEQIQKSKRDENDVAIGIPFTFDSGADITIIREDFLEQIYKVLAPGEDFQVYGTLGTYKVPCYLNDTGNFLSFSFSNKKEIQVPMSEFLLSQETANGIQCGLKISTPSPGLEDHGIFGVNFLRSVYTVFNLDDKTISLAKVKYSEDERITAIE
ncbi:hypothetical protein G9P44_001648 [Scheffersomyces stipitis]|nr:hypothetical protein G9P44_001648 [Scheffersomyces stipitis]